MGWPLDMGLFHAHDLDHYSVAVCDRSGASSSRQGLWFVAVLGCSLLARFSLRRWRSPIRQVPASHYWLGHWLLRRGKCLP